MTDAPEGWQVRQRPALIAAVAVPLVLLGALLAAGWFYTARIRPDRVAGVTSFPAPGIETYIHDGHRDPPRPLPRRTPDAAVEAAKQAIIRDGLPGWPR